MKKIFMILLICLSLLISLLSVWTIHRFGDLSLNDVVTTLYYPMGTYSSSMLKSLIKWVIFPTFLTTLFIVLVAFFSKKNKTISSIIKFCWYASMLVFGIWIIYWSTSLHLASYAKSRLQKTTIYGRDFISPLKASITFPEKKRNVVFIFLESFESEGDSQASGYYGRTNTPHLTSILEHNPSISPLNNSYYATISTTGCTTNSLVAQTSGVGVVIPLEATFSKRKLFMKQAYTLGKILKSEGYEQEFLLGSDAAFGNRSNYFNNSDLRYLDVTGLKHSHLIPQNYSQNWGVPDAVLFKIAKNQLTSISKKSPFAFRILTTDTHTPNGYTCSKCDTSIQDSYMRAIHCSDEQVYEFVSWIQRQPFYKNTTIIIAGDHESAEPKVAAALKNKKSYQRSVYYAIINPDRKVKDSPQFQNRRITAFDIFPTNLEAIGVTIPGRRLGLGVSLFSKKKTLVERYGINYLNNELIKTSDYYDKQLFY